MMERAGGRSPALRRGTIAWRSSISSTAELATTNVTVQHSGREIETLKARTGERSVAAALKSRAARVNAEHSAAELRAGLGKSLKEEAVGEGRRVGSDREAIRWFES